MPAKQEMNHHKKRFFSVNITRERVFALAAVVIIGILFFSVKKTDTSANLAGYAATVLEKCRNTSYRPSCYDEEIPQLMDTISMKDAFEVTRLVQNEDPQYIYCHVLAHRIAERETKKDPANWKDVIASCPTTMCNNGCPHGALMEYFEGESLTDEEMEKAMPDFETVCEPRGDWHPRQIEQSMCYHAIGHLFMYATDADVGKSAELCKRVGTKANGKNYVQTCTEGVFMQIFQPLEPEDEALVGRIAPKSPEAAKTFCEKYSDMAFHACRREAWALSGPELKTPKGFEDFCMYSNDEIATKTCFGTVLNQLTVLFVVDEGGSVEKMAEFCRSLSSEKNTGTCFAFAAMRLVQIDPLLTKKAAAICAEARATGIFAETECYNYLLAILYRSFEKGDEEYIRSCQTLPLSWQEECTRIAHAPSSE